MNVLVVTSSAQGEESVSGRLARHFTDSLRSANPSTQVTVRDVGRNPIPHLVEENIAGVRAEAKSEAEIAARDLSDTLIAEVRAADIVVIASPMYNFTISSTLKTWLDHLLRPRVAFRYSEEGPVGLLGGRKVVVIESRSGIYEPGSPGDSQEPYLRHVLGFAGLTDVSFVRAEGMAFGPEAAAAAIAGAQEQLSALASETLPLAA